MLYLGRLVQNKSAAPTISNKEHIRITLEADDVDAWESASDLSADENPTSSLPASICCQVPERKYFCKTQGLLSNRLMGIEALPVSIY